MIITMLIRITIMIIITKFVLVVLLMKLVPHSCWSYHTRVARVWHSCCKTDVAGSLVYYFYGEYYDNSSAYIQNSIYLRLYNDGTNYMYSWETITRST